MTKNQLPSLFYRLSLVLAVALTGCAQVMPNCGAVSSPPIHELVDSQWELIRWHYTSPSDHKTRLRKIPQSSYEIPMTLAISPDGKKVSGNAGCNLYTAEITADERGILIDKVASTRKACAPYISELEFKFLSYISDYRTLVRDGDRLLMMTRDGEVLSFALKNK